MPRTRNGRSSKSKKSLVIKRNILPIKTLGSWLIILGIVLLLFPFAFKNRIRLKAQKIPKQTIQVVATDSGQIQGPIQIDQKLLSLTEKSQPPERIVVPSLSLDLPIVEAKVINGTWELSETSASHGIGSANPSENGNIVVFAHAREDLFGPLRNLKKDQQVYLLTHDHWYKYSVEDTKEVNPDEIQVVAPTSDETLTLYTCSGFLDNKRLIVTAKPLRS